MLIFRPHLFKKLYPRCTYKPNLTPLPKKCCRIYVSTSGRRCEGGPRRPFLVRCGPPSSRQSSTFCTLAGHGDISDSGYEQLMAAASSIDNVLVLASTSVDGRLLTPHQVSTTFATLDRLAYVHLSTLPWAIHDDNRVMLCIQASLNSESKDFFHPIVRCTEFEALKNDAKNSLTAFYDADLVTVIISLLRLNVDPSDETFVALLQECQRRYETFDLLTLSAFSEVNNYMKRSGFPVSANIARVLQERWDDIAVDTLTNFIGVSRLLFNTGYFMTKDTFWHFQSKIAAGVSKLKMELLPSHVLDAMDPLSRFSERIFLDIIAPCLDVLQYRVDEMRPQHLHRALIFMRKLSTPRSIPRAEALQSQISNRGLELLNAAGGEGELRAADVVYLLNVFDICKYPHNSRSTMEKLMEDHMDDLDIILLKNASFCQMVANNRQVSRLFCRRVHSKLHDMGESISCMLSIVNCVAMMKNSPQPVDTDLVAYLLHNISCGQIGMQPNQLSTFGRYLMKCLGSSTTSHGKAATMFTEKIISSLPRMTLMEMINVARGFSVTSTPVLIASSLSRPHQVPSSSSRLFREYVLSSFVLEILSRKHEIGNLSILNLIVDSVFMNLGEALREGFAHDLVELYDKHTRTLGDVVKPFDVKMTFFMLLKLRLRVADVMERMTDAFLALHRKSSTNHSMADVSVVTHTLAKLNYRPANLNLMTDVAEAAIDDQLRRLLCDPEDGDVSRVLRIVISLSLLDVFPEKIIQRVFSLDFLHRLENVMSELNLNGKFAAERYLQRLLLQLNRAVIIQCPHLYVPWFCESYTMKLPNGLQTPHVSKWKQTMQDGLADSLGGLEFVKPGPHLAPYGLVYDFECIFNDNGKPVTHALADEHHLRVAVLLAKPQHFSMNGRNPMASLESRITQLEILGFKVVTIPYFELDSMQLSDRESRNEYFREKIWERSCIDQTCF